MTESIDQVAALFGFSKEGKKYKGLCRCHDDHNPSAYLYEWKGRVYANCYVCKDWRRVTKAFGLRVEPVTSGKAHTTGARHTKDTAPKGPMPKKLDKAPATDKNLKVAYKYNDENGNLLYEAVRFEAPGYDKNFRQRRLDSAGEWTWSTKGVRKVPYRLPELLASHLDDWVFIVEGEKDVESLVSLGLTATCNVGGAKKWLDEYSSHFVERKVAILPDNDAPGVEHAEMVAASVHSLADIVRVVDLPNLPPKGDVSDWLAAGGNNEELIALVEAAPDWAPTKTPEQATSSGTQSGQPITEAIEEYAAELGTLSLCELDDRLHLNGKPISDADMAPLHMSIYDHNARVGKDGLYIPVGAIPMAVLVISKRKTFHPVRDWLNSLKWDGGPHILALSKHFTDAHDPIRYENGATGPVFQALLARWLIGSVRRAFLGTQNPMLVLAGPQGIGKSFLPMWLASPLGEFHGYSQADGNPYFCEGSINPDSVDNQRRLTNKFVWEVGEVGGTMRRADLDALKQFLTASAATFRVPYFKYDVSKPALCNWIATVNPSIGFLSDATGNRRFRTVELTKIDWAYSSNVDPNQVWAQAVDFYRRGITVDLSDTERKAVEGINQNHQASSNEEEAILKYFEIKPEREDWYVATRDVADFLVKHVDSCRTSKGVTPVGIALAKLTGRPSKREEIAGQRAMYFRGVRPNAEYYAQIGQTKPTP